MLPKKGPRHRRPRLQLHTANPRQRNHRTQHKQKKLPNHHVMQHHTPQVPTIHTRKQAKPRLIQPRPQVPLHHQPHQSKQPQKFKKKSMPQSSQRIRQRSPTQQVKTHQLLHVNSQAARKNYLVTEACGSLSSRTISHIANNERRDCTRSQTHHIHRVRTNNGLIHHVNG